MELHRLTPVMTSNQQHNKANSILLQVQLMRLLWERAGDNRRANTLSGREGDANGQGVTLLRKAGSVKNEVSFKKRG